MVLSKEMVSKEYSKKAVTGVEKTNSRVQEGEMMNFSCAAAEAQKEKLFKIMASRESDGKSCV